MPRILGKKVGKMSLATFFLLGAGFMVVQSLFELNSAGVFAQIPTELCNCTLDYLTPNSNNLTSITIPKVSIVINESITSETEGQISWNAVKSAQLMNLVTDKFLFGNFTSGTAATVALNIINAKPNESLGVQFNGGTTPDTAKAEVLKASVNENGTLKEIQTSEKIAEYHLQYDKFKKSGSTKSGFSVNLQEPGYYLLMITLTYNSNHNSETPVQKPMSITYETILKIL